MGVLHNLVASTKLPVANLHTYASVGCTRICCTKSKIFALFIYHSYVSIFFHFPDFVEFEMVTDRKTGKPVASKLYKVVTGLNDMVEEPVEGIVVKEVREGKKQLFCLFIT